MTSAEIIQIVTIVAACISTTVNIVVGSALRNKIDLPTFQAFTREVYAKINALLVSEARKEEKIAALEQLSVERAVYIKSLEARIALQEGKK